MTASADYRALGLLVTGFPAQGLVREHFDVGLIANSLLYGNGARRVNVGGRQTKGDRPCLGAGGDLLQG